MKRILAFVLSAVMLLSLCACGGAADPNLGDYAELTGTTAEEAADSFKVDLKNGGKATFTIDGEDTDVSWKLEGETFTLFDDEQSMEGTLKDGEITLDVEGFEVVMAKQQ